MPLTKIQFRPGINREITSYSNEGGWHDCDKIRFTKGFPQKIGGWSRYGSFSYLGSVRSLLPWVDLTGSKLLGIGTNIKFYIEEGGELNDITPIRATSDAGDVTFSAVNGSSTITVSHTNHGAIEGDFVTFSGATSLGGNITADVLNQEYEVASIVDASTYTILARSPNTSIVSITVGGTLSPSLVAANASDTGNGGSSVVGAYQINVGLDVAVFGTGWGAGAWSRGAWGSAASTTILSGNMRTWSQDNFGEDLLINPRNGNIYYWDRSLSSGSFQRAVALSDLPNANGAPTTARRVIVSDRDRHIVAFGCDPVDDVGNQDPLLIRFSSQENAADWTPTTSNTAGDIRIGSGSEIITAIETRQQILIFTDASMYAMQYLGPPFTFGVNMISENTTIQGPNAAVAVDDTVFWMGRGEFYMYNGAVQRLPSAVRSYVFDDFNYSQGDQVFASSNTQHSEVWWFYPSESSTVNDRYVVFNYMENLWYFGSLGRTAWTDRGSIASPVAASEDGYLYSHDIGFDDGSTNPPSPIESYIQSSPIDIDDGDKFASIRTVFPDVVFDNSVSADPYVNVTMAVRNISRGAYVKTSTGSYYDNDREKIDFRLRGRQMSIKISSDALGVTWRLGIPRVDMRTDGKR
jgi:hypothetical protein